MFFYEQETQKRNENVIKTVIKKEIMKTRVNINTKETIT